MGINRKFREVTCGEILNIGWCGGYFSRSGLSAGTYSEKKGTGEPSPSLQALKEAGFQPSEAESLLCRQHLWEGNKVLLTAKEQRFYRIIKCG